MMYENGKQFESSTMTLIVCDFTLIYMYIYYWPKVCTQFTARVMFVSKRSFKGTQPHSTLSRHSCIAHDVKKSFRDVEL